MLTDVLGAHQRAGRVRLGLTLIILAGLTTLLLGDWSNYPVWFRVWVVVVAFVAIAICSVSLVAFWRSRNYMRLRRKLWSQCRRAMGGGTEAVGRSAGAVIVVQQPGRRFGRLTIYELGLRADEPGYYLHQLPQPFRPEPVLGYVRSRTTFDGREPRDEITGLRYGRLGQPERLDERELAGLIRTLEGLRVDRRS